MERFNKNKICDDRKSSSDGSERRGPSFGGSERTSKIYEEEKGHKGKAREVGGDGWGSTIRTQGKEVDNCQLMKSDGLNEKNQPAVEVVRLSPFESRPGDSIVDNKQNSISPSDERSSRWETGDGQPSKLPTEIHECSLASVKSKEINITEEEQDDHVLDTCHKRVNEIREEMNRSQTSLCYAFAMLKEVSSALRAEGKGKGKWHNMAFQLEAAFLLKDDAMDGFSKLTEKAIDVVTDVHKEACRLDDEYDSLIEKYNRLVKNRDTLKKKNDYIKNEFMKLKSEMPTQSSVCDKDCQTVSQAPSGPVTPVDGESNISALFEDLKKSLIQSVGNMVNTRIEALEDRLLPKKDHSPLKSTTAFNEEIVQSRTGPLKESVSVQTVGKGRKKAAPIKKPKAAFAPSTQGLPTEDVKKRKAPKQTLTVPKTTAVTLTIPMEAEAKGITYASVIAKAKRGIKLSEIGIPDLQMKVAATGARILKIPGTHSGEKAEKLAEKLREVLKEEAEISRPIKRVDMRITDLEDSIDEEELRMAVAGKGGCLPEHIVVGPIKLGIGGLRVALLRCPVAAAKVLAKEGRLTIGWTIAKIRVLDPLPMRCFKCMGTGHVRRVCPFKEDRTGLCFRCGEEGHKAAECKERLHCVVCADAQLPAEHLMGSKVCCPPAMRVWPIISP